MTLEGSKLMASGQLDLVLRHLHMMVNAERAAELTDAELLRQFTTQRDESAFAALVHRHGPLILSVCRRLLHDHHKAEDAFQATFLVLARKAAGIHQPELVVSWLHKVAYRIAVKALADSARRREQEREACSMRPTKPDTEITLEELRAVLDEEMQRLPEKYQAPLMLCYMEGKSHAEAAHLLGWPLGTIKGRLARAREVLRTRLTRRGVALSAGSLTVALTENAATATTVPAGLIASTVKAAIGFGVEKATAGGGISAKVAGLAEGAIKAMVVTKMKGSVVLAVAVGVLAVGVGLGAYRALGAKPQAAEAVGQEKPVSERGEIAQRVDKRQDRTDHYGDPLPAKAISRLGTTRLRHGEFVSFVRFTPDGKTLVTHGGDGVRTWDITTGKQIHAFPKETKGAVWGRASLSPDGKLLATASDSGIHVWDVATAKPVSTFGGGDYLQVCFSPDGRKILALGLNNPAQVQLLEASTGRQLWAWSAGNEPPACTAFAPDGKTVIVAGWNGLRVPPSPDHTIRFLDATTGKEQRQIDLGTRTPRNLAVSPDGRLLSVIFHSGDSNNYEERQIGIWEVASGKERFRLSQPTAGTYGQRYFSAMTFTPDSKSLVTAGGEDSLMVWDLATGKQQRRLGRAMTNSSDLTFAPDGKTVAVARAGTLIRLIDWGSGDDRLPTPGHHYNVNQTAIAADGQTVVTASAGPCVIFWDPVTGREQRRLGQHEPSFMLTLADDGRTGLLRKYQGKTVRLWDLATDKERCRVSLDFTGGPWPGLKAIGPGENVLAMGNWDSDTIQLIDSTTGKVFQSFKDPGLKQCKVNITADSKTLIAFCDDRTVQVWDVSKGAKLRQFGPLDEYEGPAPVPVGGQRASYAATLSADGRWAAYGSQYGRLLLFDVATGQEFHRLEKLPSGAGVLAFSPDGRTLAWGGWRDPVVHLLEVATGKERESLAGHRGSVQSLSFFADGKRLVSGSNDTTALVWDLTGRLGARGGWGKSLTAAELDACWADLGGADAPRAYDSIRRLAAAPAQAVDYLEKRLRAVPAADEKVLTRLLAELDSDQFGVRETAAKELDRLGETAIAPCRKALAGRPSGELRRRLEALLTKRDLERRNPLPDRLRELRALEALELAGSPEAIQVLQMLSKGAPDARLTQEVKASLERLAKRAALSP